VELGPEILSRAGEPLDTNRNAGVDALRGVPSAGATVPITVPSADVPQALAPLRATTSFLDVTDDFVIQGATLALNIAFPNDPDLTATLIAPDGTRIQLFSGVGTTGTRANFGTANADTIFDDAAPTPIQNGSPPFVGRFRPQVGPNLISLSGLIGRAAAGRYLLEIANASGTLTGTLNRWSLTLRRPVPGNGLGEPVADRTSAAFRIFTTAPANPLASTTWTSVGPASINGNENSGRIGGIAVDPSDPSGNTVFIGGASGGIWKTTNFLTTDSRGPTYVPLTDFGPTFAINIGGIAVFPRNNDPNQSIVFAATGEGDTASPGVGMLRSFDGGATWTLLDSTTNVDANGQPLPISDPRRDHIFVGTSAFKILVDPRPSPVGEVIVYAALIGPSDRDGIWRSLDTGRTWQRVLTGGATDIVVDPASAVTDVFGNPGNLQTLFAGVAGQGVFRSNSQGNVGTWTLLTGSPGGHPLIQDGTGDVPPGTPVPVNAPAQTPSGPKGRIVLAKPALTGNPAQDALYQGWLYAAVVTPGPLGRTLAGGNLDGLYLTKDANLAQVQNWTLVRLPNRFTPATSFASQGAIPSNDGNLSLAGDYDPLGNALFAQGNYDVALAIDPLNPNIVYLGGTQDGNVTGLLRIDTTGISDPYAFFLDNDNNDGGAVRAATGDPIALKDVTRGVFSFVSANLPIDPRANPYLNLLRDPRNPGDPNATITVFNTARFTNTGVDARWIPFDIEGTDQHRFVTLVDPLTGRTRLIIGDDQGVYSAVDNGVGFDLASGTRGLFDPGIGTARSPGFSRNGNLQITQFYYGAAQPSSVAAQAAGALFYGQAQDNGFPVSDPNVLANGNLNWTGPEGDGTGVATDQTGTGTLYRYNWPCCGGSITDFFRVTLPGQVEVGRTNGLVGNDPGPNVPDRQWPFLGGFNFAVNPVVPAFVTNPTTGQRAEIGQVVISSALGRVFRTLDNGQTWQLIGDPVANPAILDGSNAQALAFGAPANANATGGQLGDFIFAGTLGATSS
jgi:subtilisin-like proprotein convertase family protein